MKILGSLSTLLATGLLTTMIAEAQSAPTGLILNIVKGEAGMNSIKSRTGTSIEVEVKDDQNKVVAGAQVIFRLPTFGPSGSFPGGQLVQRTTTAANGRAIMNGFVPNDIVGRFNIKISGDSGTLSGSAVVSQVNVAMLAADKPKSHKALWILIAAGAGGGVAAAVLSGGKSSVAVAAAPPPPPAPSVTLTPGTIAVGGPH